MPAPGSGKRLKVGNASGPITHQAPIKPYQALPHGLVSPGAFREEPMESKKMLKLSYGGLGLYLLISAFFYLTGDKEHGLMFLCGSAMWIIAALIWGRNVNNGD